jgi:hypothetical protein
MANSCQMRDFSNGWSCCKASRASSWIFVSVFCFNLRCRGEKQVPTFKQVAIEDETTVEEFRSHAGLDLNRRVVLAGLHCCGQLSVNVLRLFVMDPNCKGLALVSNIEKDIVLVQP